MATDPLTRFKRASSIRKAIPMGADGGLIALSSRTLDEADEPNSLVLSTGGDNRLKPVARFRLNADTMLALPRAGSCILMDMLGYYVEIDGDQNISGSVFGKLGHSASHATTLGSLSDIQGVPYVAGMQGSIYRRTQGEWSPLPAAEPPSGDFESIDGFTHDEIYAVGWNGAMWYFNGSVWHDVGGLTNVILTKVCCADNGKVYICGQSGVLLEGRQFRWAVADIPETDVNFWDIGWFGDRLFVASSNALYEMTDELKRVDFGDDRPELTQYIATNAHVLWSVSQSDIMCFDGRSWRRVL